MNKFLKTKKGITLVALVVTIIILLILAGISIATLTGSGLFEKARLAEQKSKNAQDLEDSTLKNYENKIGEYVQGNREQIMVDKDRYEQLIKDVESLKKQNTNTNYSTEETVVGTWINGKPIYRKIINSGTVDTSIDNIIYTDSTIETLITTKGLLSQGSNLHVTIPMAQKNNFLGYIIKVNSDIIFRGSSYSDTWDISFIFLEYTKTTD